MNYPNTELNYLENTYIFEDTAITLSIDIYESQKIIILNQTIFYPQGGGQPYDQGYISTDSGKFEVTETRFKDGIVYHIGDIIEGNINSGQQALLKINKERRILNSRLHTAGHLLDIALKKIGLTLTPIKGYHFPQGPYVEYVGIIEAEKREEIKISLEKVLSEMISNKINITTKLVNKNELEKLCETIPEYIPKDKPCRVVTIEGFLGCPCGGTHLETIKEIISMTIPKISSKKGNTRIRYNIA